MTELMPTGPALAVAQDAAVRFLEDLPKRGVGATLDAAALRARFDVGLPDGPTDGAEVVRDLVAAAEPGLVASAGPRYFGFVTGGGVPAALAADWLAAAWDQNAHMALACPAATAVEEVAGRWLLELLGLPGDASFAFVTGGQMANTTSLAAARHHVLAARGWDVERQGLAGAPPVRVVAGAERHACVDASIRQLGLGTDNLVLVEADEQGRMRVDRLAAVFDGPPRPTIVVAQAGNVNTGACDDLAAVNEIAHGHAAWVHVDGAFGLWAAASPSYRHLVTGHDGCDSWATDGHKWLNVPYDSGFAFCAHPESHRAATALSASYLSAADSARDPMDWVFEASRRARGFPTYAALRSLGRSGVADLVDRCCILARRFAERVAADDRAEVLNDVVLNQVLVRFGDDARTRAVVEGVQREGTCWMGGTVWHGMAAMRVSVSNWSTAEEDIDRSVGAVLRVASSV